MNVLDFAVMSTEGLRERKFRFALNLVGILIGCAAVTGLISMSQGMKTSIVDDISIFGATTVQVYPTLGGDEAFTSLDWRDLNRLRSIAGVEAAAPVQAGRYGRYDYRGMTYSNEVVGVDENYFMVHGGENDVEDGRLLTHSDGAAALLGYNVWNPDDEARYGVGDRLRIRSNVNGDEIEFTIRVVGTLKKTSSITGSGVDDYIILHLGYFEQVFDTQGRYLAVDLKAETIDDVEGIKQALEEDFDNLGYYSMDMIMEEVNMITGTINAVLGRHSRDKPPRHRSHHSQHHDGERHGANQGDRHHEGNRSHKQGRAAPLHLGEHSDGNSRRRPRGLPRVRVKHRHRTNHQFGTRALLEPRPHGHRIRDGDLRGLRHLPCLAGVQPEPHGGA